MQFTFTKEIIPNFTHTDYGDLGTCSIFTISSEQGSVGKFFHSRRVAFFAFADYDIRIDYIHRFFRRSRYPIIDQKIGREIGHYDKESFRGFFSKYGKLFLRDRMYSCEKLQPPVKRNIFRKSTWGFYILQISHYPDIVTYHFSIENLTHFNTVVSDKPFTGEITLEGGNLFLLFAGIFLLEQVLDFEDGD